MKKYTVRCPGGFIDLSHVISCYAYDRNNSFEIEFQLTTGRTFGVVYKSSEDRKAAMDHFYSLMANLEN